MHGRKNGFKGSKKDGDVEFTFRPGRWGHLGEATLANRVKSHPNVGARWVSNFHPFLAVVVIALVIVFCF